MITLHGPGNLSIDIDDAVGATLHSLRGPWAGDLLAAGFPPRPSLDARSPFVDSGLRGWVDCFPSIARDDLWFGGRKVTIADHGEAWFRPWVIERVTLSSVVLRCTLDELGVVLSKQLAWVGADLQCRTMVSNSGNDAVPFVWAAHALFDLTPEDTLNLPPDARETFRYEQFPGHGPIDDYWPSDDAGRRSWGDLPRGAMAKYFLTWPSSGVEFTCHGQDLHLEWIDPPAAAQLGLWINRHGFPSGTESVSHAGIEPGLGWPDSLSTAARQGSAAMLAPATAVRMDLVLHVGHRRQDSCQIVDEWNGRTGSGATRRSMDRPATGMRSP